MKPVTIIIVAVAVIGCGVAVFLIKANSEMQERETAALNSKLAAAQAEVSRLAPEAARGRAMPVEVTTRKAAFQNGYVLTLKNKTSEPMAVTITFSRGGKTQTFERTLSGGPIPSATEIGGHEGWDAVAGDIATITSIGFDPIRQKF